MSSVLLIWNYFSSTLRSDSSNCAICRFVLAHSFRFIFRGINTIRNDQIRIRVRDGQVAIAAIRTAIPLYASALACATAAGKADRTAARSCAGWKTSVFPRHNGVRRAVFSMRVQSPGRKIRSSRASYGSVSVRGAAHASDTNRNIKVPVTFRIFMQNTQVCARAEALRRAAAAPRIAVR
jgi:hypothetical protein